jgi:hypothetical protein
VVTSIDLSHVEPERKRASVESSLFSSQVYRIAKMGLGARFLQRVVKNEAMKKWVSKNVPRLFTDGFFKGTRQRYTVCGWRQKIGVVLTDKRWRVFALACSGTYLWSVTLMAGVKSLESFKYLNLDS